MYEFYKYCYVCFYKKYYDQENDSYVFNERLNDLNYRIDKIVEEHHAIFTSIDADINKLSRDLHTFKQNQIRYDNTIEGSIRRIEAYIQDVFTTMKDDIKRVSHNISIFKHNSEEDAIKMDSSVMEPPPDN